MTSPPACLARFVVASLLLLFAFDCGVLDVAGTAAEPEVSFEQDVHPILKTHCFYCHGEAGLTEGGLDLRLRRWVVRGGDSGSAVTPHDVADSRMLQRIEAGEMPPGEDKRLGEDEIAVIRQWIRAGAPTLGPEPESLDGPRFTPAEREWWAFQPIHSPPLPAGTPAATPIDSLLLARMREMTRDSAANLAAEAERPLLIRRLYLDLLGMPPSPADVAAFVHDTRPQAWGRLVDETLASPRYGERWGRHWLDASGYADSEGYTESDPERPHAYHYRDYVIRAWNQGMGYDQFVREQLAGDELADWPGAPLTPRVKRLLAATGFLRMAPDGTAAPEADADVAKNQAIADTLQVVGVTLTGMTMHCAQCHDHRYDPIPQSDYYRLRAIFEPALDWKRWQTPPQRRVSLYTRDDAERRDAIEADAKQVDKQRDQRVQFFIQQVLEQELLLEDPEERAALRQAFNTSAQARSDEQRALLESRPNIGRITAGSLYLYDRRKQTRTRNLTLRKESLDPQSDAEEIGRIDAAIEQINQYQIRKELQALADKAAEIREAIPVERFLRPLTEPDRESGPTPVTRVFHRGDFQQPRDAVEPGGLSILAVPFAPDERPKTSGRRLGYANHLLDPRHPLVSRVMANRIWAHHFGRGLAPTPGDFGRLGEPPTHPQLLDYLAAELLRSGWDIKRLQRRILMSAAYRQSVNGDPRQVERDPGNRWYSRWTARRLEAESVRDTMLAVAGRLNLAMYGTPVPVREDEVGQIVLGREMLDGERKPTRGEPLGGEAFRRSVYVQVRRSRPLSVMESFDLPETAPHCPQRASSNVTPQALMLMNSRFVVDVSRSLAQRLRDESADPAEQLDLVWRLCYSQPLDDGTRQELLEFLRRQRDVLEEDDDALASLCQALLSSSQFLYIE